MKLAVQKGVSRKMWYIQTPPEEKSLRKAIASAYWKAECRWKRWLQEHPYDTRTGTKYSGSPEENGIAADWKVFASLFGEWKSRYPPSPGRFWGIDYPSHEPTQMNGWTPTIKITC